MFRQAYTILLINISTSEKKNQFWKSTALKRIKLRLQDWSHFIYDGVLCNNCVSTRAKIKNWKSIKLNDYIKIIIEIDQGYYFFAKFALNNEIEPYIGKVDKENILQITENFSFVHLQEARLNSKIA